MSFKWTTDVPPSWWFLKSIEESFDKNLIFIDSSTYYPPFTKSCNKVELARYEVFSSKLFKCSNFYSSSLSFEKLLLFAFRNRDVDFLQRFIIRLLDGA